MYMYRYTKEHGIEIGGYTYPIYIYNVCVCARTCVCARVCIQVHERAWDRDRRVHVSGRARRPRFGHSLQPTRRVAPLPPPPHIHYGRRHEKKKTHAGLIY
jgi:hypothetical protein